MDANSKILKAIKEQSQYLFLSRYNLEELPDFFDRLKEVRFLFLDHNKLKKVPKAILKLKKLEYLFVSHNYIENLPDELFNLEKLSYLDLDYNQIKRLPIGIEKLHNLKYLSLKGNNLDNLPHTLSKLSRLDSINIEGNPLKSIPKEIYTKSFESLFSYLKNMASRTQLLEAKVLIVGAGSVGKSTLMKRILFDEFKSNEITTEGIEINYWKTRSTSQKDLTINFWDFGGQEIYHSTHQFFLTKRSLYLFIWEARTDDNLINFDYWLNIIKLLSNSSPTIVVMNKSDERIRNIEEESLMEKFPNIKYFIRVSALTGEGLDTLKKEIVNNIEKLDHIGEFLPTVWLEVRKKLKSLDKDYISIQSYLRICKDYGLNEDDSLILSQYLHDLGVFLHFSDNEILKDIIFLNPEWATNAVYKIIYNRDVQESNGEFNFNDLKSIWTLKDGYSEKNFIHLIELMKKFELCFQLPNTNRFIVPELLKVSIPKIEMDTTKNLLFVYKYRFMPAGIISRFIVRIHDLIVDNFFWKGGVLIEREGTSALVLSNILDRKLTVRLVGNDKKGLLSIIRREIEYINKTLNFPEVNELIPCVCEKCKDSKEPHFYNYKKLRQFRLNGTHEIPCENSYKTISIEELLGEFENPDDKTAMNEVLSILKELREKHKNDESFIHEANKILELKPGLFGVSLNINAIIDKFIKKKDSQS